MVNRTTEDSTLIQALIGRCALNDESVTLIEAVERTLGISFAEAALRLELVTQADLDHCRPEQTALVARPKSTPTQHLQLLSAPASPQSERIRVLRTELLLRRDDETRGAFIAVLSPCANEGRSTIAAELAISLAQLHQPTLLIDVDLRRPTQHLLFGTDDHHGLSNAITEGVEPLLHGIQGVDSLSLLTAGPVPSQPLELISDGRFEQLVKSLRRKFAYVIFDTPPIAEYADGLIVASIAGHSLIVSRVDQTPQRAMDNLVRRLRTTQSQVLGAVINHF